MKSADRARRMEYWMFVLINFFITIGIGLLQGLLGLGEILGTLYGLAIFIPSLAVSVRRLHDSGRSGWWILLFLILMLTSTLGVAIGLLVSSIAPTTEFAVAMLPIVILPMVMFSIPASSTIRFTRVIVSFTCFGEFFLRLRSKASRCSASGICL